MLRHQHSYLTLEREKKNYAKEYKQVVKPLMPNTDYSASLIYIKV